MRELLSLKIVALAAVFVVTFALAGFGTARLLPAPSYATASISAAGGLPAEGELDEIAKEVDANLADRGLPSRVTATRTKISVLVPPSSKTPAEVEEILARSLADLPAPRVADRLQANIQKIRRAEELVARNAANPPATGTFDFSGYAEAVMTLASESDRLASIAEARDPKSRTIEWNAPNIAMHTQRVSSISMAALCGAFGLLLFCVFIALGAAFRVRASPARVG